MDKLTLLQWIELGISLFLGLTSLYSKLRKSILKSADSVTTTFISGFFVAISEFFFGLFALSWANQNVPFVVFIVTVIFGICFMLWCVQNRTSIYIVQPSFFTYIAIMAISFFTALTIISAEVGTLYYVGFLK